MEHSYSKKAAFAVLLSDVVTGIGRLHLCVRTRSDTYNKNEEMDIPTLVDKYPPGIQKFTGNPQLRFNCMCSRACIHSLSAVQIVGRSRADLLSVVGQAMHDRVLQMIETHLRHSYLTH
jgi:hypothetical protein